MIKIVKENIVTDESQKDLVPKVEAPPVVNGGRWVDGRFNSLDGAYEEQCSECKEWSRDYGNYCSHCGAKMDK